MIRLFHGHDEVVAIPGSDQSEEEQRWETQLPTDVSLPVAAGYIQQLILEQRDKMTTEATELHPNLEALASLDGTEMIFKLSPAEPLCRYLQTQSALSLTDSVALGYQGACLLGEKYATLPSED